MPLSAAGISLFSAITVLLLAIVLPTACAWAEGILDAHNAARASHGAAPLAWNDALSAAAVDYASQCVWQHSGSGDGENLYLTSVLPSSDSLDDPSAQEALKQAVDSWMSEESQYDYNNPEAFFDNGAGHFTQVVWKGSTDLGCGFAACSNGVANSDFAQGTLVVCRYSPPGNIVGAVGDNVGAPSGGRKLKTLIAMSY